MKSGWHLFEENKPPEQAILLVNGPLGLDLAVKLEDNLYFKKGDVWGASNIEHWSFNTPTEWAELALPDKHRVGFAKIVSENREDPKISE